MPLCSLLLPQRCPVSWVDRQHNKLVFQSWLLFILGLGYLLALITLLLMKYRHYSFLFTFFWFFKWLLYTYFLDYSVYCYCIINVCRNVAREHLTVELYAHKHAHTHQCTLSYEGFCCCFLHVFGTPVSPIWDKWLKCFIILVLTSKNWKNTTAVRLKNIWLLHSCKHL